MPRLKLRIKKDKPYFGRLKYSKFELDGFDWKEKRKILNYASNKTGIDINEVFNLKKSKNKQFKSKTWYIDLQFKMLKMLIELVYTDQFIDFDFVDQVCSEWNGLLKESKEWKKCLSGIRINIKSKKYIHTCICIMYCLFQKCNGNKQKLLGVFDRIREYGSNNKPFFNSALKIDCYFFFAPFDKNYFIDAYLGDRNDFFRFATERKVMYPDALNKLKEVYFKYTTYLDKDLNISLWKKNEYILSKWLDKKINAIVYNRVNVENTKLFMDTGISPAIISIYLKWLSEYKQNNLNGRAFLIYQIVDPQNWISFIDNIMRGEYGLKNYWTPVKYYKQESRGIACSR